MYNFPYSKLNHSKKYGLFFFVNFLINHRFFTKVQLYPIEKIVKAALYDMVIPIIIGTAL